MSTLAIVCAACSTEFDFSAEEQAFYESRGFTPPKKCKPCRSEAKLNRQQGERGHFSHYNERPLFDVICSECNAPTQVPFKPNGTKPVYCRNCFKR
ncbi:MAG: CxxC-x17-CxxC domain-containing protein [Vampirovibrionales bacterium]